MSALAERLNDVRARIARACARADRPVDQVELIAVSKLHPPSAIEEAYGLGLRHFGENYAQELRDKSEALKHLRGLRWHAIGPLQTNKAKYVAKSAHVFHALDRLEVAQELSRRRTGEPLDCFIELNAGGEASKGGVPLEAAEALLEAVRPLPHLRVVGLMALPPLTDHPEDSRAPFRRVAELARRLGLPQLSLGSTHDFEVAIEEGATHVRVGTALFGERPSA